MATGSCATENYTLWSGNVGIIASVPLAAGIAL